MASDINIKSWTVDHVKRTVQAAAHAKEHDKPLWHLSSGLTKVLRAVEEQEVVGAMIEHIDKDFLTEAGLTSWKERTPFLVFFKSLFEEPAKTLDRIQRCRISSTPSRTSTRSDQGSYSGSADGSQSLGRKLSTATTSSVERPEASVKTNGVLVDTNTPPVSTTRPVPSSARPSQPVPTVPHATQPNQTVEASTVKQPKRAVLQTVVTVPPAIVHDAGPGFMPTKAFELDEMFYAGAKIGEEIPSRQSDDPDHESNNIGPEHRNVATCFEYVPQRKVSLAVARFVNHRIKYFLRDDSSLEATDLSSGNLILAPYRSMLKAKPSATIFQMTDGKATAIRAQLLNTSDGTRVLTEEEIEDEYSELLRRYPDQLENDEDDASSLDLSANEVSTEQDVDEDDMAEEASDEESTLSNEQRRAFIDQAIAEFIAEWQLKLDKLEATKARAVWRKQKKSKYMRALLVDNAHSRITHLEKRLQEQKDNLIKYFPDTTAEAKRTCEVMQPTVWEIEEKRWNINVWQRRAEPAGPSNIHSRPGRQAPTSSAPMNGFLADLGDDDRMSIDSTPVPPDVGSPNAASSAAASELGPDVSEVAKADANNDNDNSMADFVEEDSEVTHQSNATSLSVAESKDKPRAMTPATPISVSDSDDNVSSRHKRTPQPTPRRQHGMFSRIKARIDALVSSDDDDEPPIKRVKLERPSPAKEPSSKHRHQQASSKQLQHMNVTDVDDLDLETLLLDRSYEKLLVKLLATQDQQFRDELTMICKEQGDQLPDYIRICLMELAGDLDPCNLDDNPYRQVCKERLARVVVAWWKASLEPFEDTFQDWTEIAELIQKDGDDEGDVGRVADYLRKILASERRSLFAPVDQTVIILDSSDDDPDEVVAISPEASRRHKRRLHRKAPKQSRQTQNTVQQALERHARFKKQQQSQVVQELSQTGSQQDLKLEINTLRDENEPPIYITSRVAMHLKSHQIEGVQFMWKELTEPDTDVRGCLLSHTMGLGKTIQSIAVMSTIMETSRSGDDAIREQLPKSLRPRAVVNASRQLRMLVLLPPTLIDNWQAELKKWAPKTLGSAFVLKSTPDTRETILEDWHRDGGVLLIGYAMFRNCILGRRKTDTSAELARSAQILIDGAELVVADEAHNFKNADSKTGKAVQKLKAKHRIALTGTPLSNDIDEVFALLSWVAPGYLGDKEDFNYRFANPIKEGLYHDSSAYEVRTSKKKQQVLLKLTEPKCLRRGIEALKGELPPKTEFILTVSPTSVQLSGYRAFVRALAGQNDMEKVSSVQIFSWLNAMTLLLNHPSAFREKLQQVPKPRKQKLDSPADTDAASDAADVTVDIVKEPEPEPDLSEVLVHGLSQQARDGILASSNITADRDVDLSPKTALFMDIVQLSRQAGDKTLVFTSTLVTLEYLAQVLSSHGIKYGRIEGKVKERMQIIDDLNNDTDVLLISTRAGGTGYNMQAANRVIIIDSGFNPAHEEQAIARSYRFGQEKQVYVYRFVCGGTFEENMENKQLFKTSLAQRVVDKKNPQRNASRNVSEWLMDPKAVVQKDVSEWTGKDNAVLDHILRQQDNAIEAKKIYSIRTMETLHADAKDAELNEEEKREVEREFIETRSRRKQAAQAATAPVPPVAMPGPASQLAANVINGTTQNPFVPTAVMLSENIAHGFN